MRFRFLLLGAALVTFATTATAADIKGKVNGKSGPVVVWLEGVKKFQPPSSHPSMSQRGQRFSPSLLVVVVGQTVDMPNDDNVAHNVFSFSPAKQFNLGIYPKGETKSVTFTRPGIIELYCSIHHQMAAKIIVVPSPFFAQIDAGEQYRIAGVPPGKYVLKMWGQEVPSQSKTITVPESGEVQVDF